MKILVLVFHLIWRYLSQIKNYLNQYQMMIILLSVICMMNTQILKLMSKKTQEIIENHDRIVIQFPFQWYSSPALFKQWQDDVLEYGWAYGSAGDALHNKELMLAVTTGAPEEIYTASNESNITIEELLSPIRATSKMVGLKYLNPFIVHGVASRSVDELKKRYESYYNYITTQ